jgi:hypothetical protein
MDVVTAAQADWIVRGVDVELLRYAGFLDQGSGNLPSAGDGLDQSLALAEEGNVVDVVGVEDLAAIVGARTLVVLDIPGLSISLRSLDWMSIWCEYV